MIDLVFHVLFVIASLYVFLKAVFYAVYEIKTQDNKAGGIGVIVFSVIVIVFANIIVLIRWIFTI